MTPITVANAVRVAENFVDLARTFDRVYPTYTDGRGQEHYVPGPGSRQVREATNQLIGALNGIRYSTSAALPSLDVSAQHSTGKGGTPTR